MVEYGPPERVFVENEWWDDPRAGIANINGRPHRFKSLFDEENDDYLGTFLVWPVDQQVLDLEVEQWRIFVEWNRLYEAGEVDTDSHPANGGRNARWDELEKLLQANRVAVPPEARQAVAQFDRLDRDERFAPSGPDYTLRWSVS